MPTNAIYSAPSGQNNSNNTVSNSNIFNYYSTSASNGWGLRFEAANTGWTITGNSFYQTTTRTANANAVFGIGVFGGEGYTITNNFIGGSAPSAGGAAWTTTGTTVAHRFVGIQLNVGTTTPISSVQGNTIKNFVWTSSTTPTGLPGVWIGVYVSAGSVNIGTTTGNTIGSGSGTGSISVTTSAVGCITFGIGSLSSDTVNISNNTIGSITTNGTTSSIGAWITGIQANSGTNTISNNTIGSTTTANSLNAATSSTSSTGQGVTGILSTGGANITGNTIANLNNNYAGTAALGQVRGIVTQFGANTITGNTVRNLSTTSANTNSTTSQSVFGIVQTSTTAGQTVSNNIVHSLSNTSAGANVSVAGIYYTGAASGTNVIARNLVHSLAVSSNSVSSQMNGMYFANGTFTAQNNMVRVGLNASGAGTAGVSVVRCILDNGLTAGRSFYHNSGYLGGTETVANALTAAFQSQGTSNARTFQNNIFVNARANAGGTGKHYAVRYSGSGVNPPGLTAGGNIIFTSGAGGVFGSYGAADLTTLAAWQAATGQDTSSGFADPLFVNPTGNSAAVDLHLMASNPAEGGGILVASVTDDFDGETRSGLTPTDIGADAGNFTSSGDIFAPAVSYPALSNGSTANRTLTGFATITDNIAVSGGANSPRLYFKKATDADTFGGNTSADNGWKYVAATNAVSRIISRLIIPS